MASFSNSSLEEVFSALHCQQKLYLSACCHRNNYLEATEQSINMIMLPTLENMAVEDIMNGGDHNIKNIGPQPELPVLTIDSNMFCSYQTAKRTNILGALGCPLDGNMDLINEGKALLEMINDLRTLSPADFAKKYPMSGEFYNGTARLISMLEKLYNAEDFEESSFSTKLVEGNIRFDNRAKVAVMQFINSNGTNRARYESSALYYGDTEITTVGAGLEFKRNSTSEAFVLSKLKLLLFVDAECSRHYPFEIALGSGENIACRSLGQLFTENTYPRFADNASESRTGVWHIPAGMFREKACGSPSDKRTINQMLDDYETVVRRTSTPQFVFGVMNNELSDEDFRLASDLKDYNEFIEGWCNALDFVQYSTLTRTMLNTRDPQNIRVISLLESKEEYSRYLALLSGGFDKRVHDTLLDRAEYPDNITKQIEYYDLTAAAGSTMRHFEKEVFSNISGNMCDQLTVADLKDLIDSTKAIRRKFSISDENLVVDSFNALFKADKENTAYTIYEKYDKWYAEDINKCQSGMARFSLSIATYLYYNATLLMTDNNVIMTAGRTEYCYDEDEKTHEICLPLSTYDNPSCIRMFFRDGHLVKCSYEEFDPLAYDITPHPITGESDVDKYVRYPEVKAAVMKYLNM